MADILVQNAITEVTEALLAPSEVTAFVPASPHENLAGIDLSGIPDKVRQAFDNNLPEASGGGGVTTFDSKKVDNMCMLSCQCCIGSCYSALRGAGTSDTGAYNNQGNKASCWITTLDTASEIRNYIGVAIASTPEMSTYKSMIDAMGTCDMMGSSLTNLCAKDPAGSYPSCCIMNGWDKACQLYKYIESVSIQEYYNSSEAVKTAWSQTLGQIAVEEGSTVLPPDATGSLKVCGTGWKYGCGDNQNWVVPAGATRAKFQVWGAGAGSNPGCCCGGQSFGATGTYTEAWMDVTAGDTYTLCAGCSCGERYCCSNSHPSYACMSGVTGPGICCLKADGGCSSSHTAQCMALNSHRTTLGAGGVCGRFQNPWCTSSGPCWCGNGEYCYESSCATCGVIPIYSNCCERCACSEICSDRNPIHNQWIRSFHGGGCLDTNNYGWHSNPPLIDADTCMANYGGCAQQTFSSSCCCGGCNGKDWDWHPGHGGTATHTMGGNNNHKGDTGRGGMVMVSWK